MFVGAVGVVGNVVENIVPVAGQLMASLQTQEEPEGRPVPLLCERERTDTHLYGLKNQRRELELLPA